MSQLANDASHWLRKQDQLSQLKVALNELERETKDKEFEIIDYRACLADIVALCDRATACRCLGNYGAESMRSVLALVREKSQAVLDSGSA